MSLPDSIRALAREGVTVPEIARRLGLRPQQVHKVLNASRATRPVPGAAPAGVRAVVRSSGKPPLPVAELQRSGFHLAGQLARSGGGDVRLDANLPSAVGVYALASQGHALFVGNATNGLADRLQAIASPGTAQSDNQRLNGLIRAELARSPVIEIYVAVPPELEWTGYFVHGSAGLELRLVERYDLPWSPAEGE